jgi:hypothetical protein
VRGRYVKVLAEELTVYEGDVVRIRPDGDGGEPVPDGWAWVALQPGPGRAGLVPEDVLERRLGWMGPDPAAVLDAAAAEVAGQAAANSQGGAGGGWVLGSGGQVGGVGAWGPGMRAGRVLRPGAAAAAAEA